MKIKDLPTGWKEVFIIDKNENKKRVSIHVLSNGSGAWVYNKHYPEKLLDGETTVELL